MTLAHPQLDTIIDFSCSQVNTVVIENPDFLRALICDLYSQLQGNEGDFILSDDNKILPISKWAELIDNCIHFELNRKTLVNKICATMEQTANTEGFFLKTTELLGAIEAYVENLAFELPGDIICGKCSVAGILKGIGISLRDDYEDPLERLLDLMELIREFDRDKLFVLLGMRSFYSDEKMEQFLKTVLDHKYRVLLIDSISKEMLFHEKRITIDIDLCEF